MKQQQEEEDQVKVIFTNMFLLSESNINIFGFSWIPDLNLIETPSMNQLIQGGSMLEQLCSFYSDFFYF